MVKSYLFINKINFYPVIDIFTLGNKNIILHISIKNLNDNIRLKFNNILRLNKVNWVSEFFSEYNLGVSVVYSKQFELISTMNEIISILGENILDIEIKYVSKYFLIPHTFEKNEFKNIFIVENKDKTPIKLSNTENKILDLLLINCRISYVELSKKLNLDSNTIKYNISKLERNGIIKGYKSLINFKKLGYNWIQIKFKTYSKINNNVLLEKGVIFVSICLDGTIILNVLYSDISEIQIILNNIQNKIGQIYNLKTSEILKIYKLKV